MSSILLSLMMLAVNSVAAPQGPEQFCKRLPVDEEVPAGIAGTYEVVGKDPVTGRPYLGTLRIETTPESYALTRTTHDGTVEGEAWLESCGADRRHQLVATYESQGKKLHLTCYLDMDADNYYRASCRYSGGHGLEAWYQAHESSP